VDDLEKNRFAMGSLFGKLLFIDDDVRAGARLPEGILKTISEAKEVTGELKYKQPFNFVVRTVPPAVQQRALARRPLSRHATQADGDPVRPHIH
jgi:phage/plasmid-associated DNA primase